MGRKRSRKANKKISKKFNDLNDDVKREIFDYLDGDSMKDAMEVCKKWNKFIGGSSSCWRNFKFVVPKDWETSKVVIQKMSRLVTTVEFKNLDIDNAEICDVLKKFGMQFKVMIFDNVDIDAEIFKKLVSMFQLDKLIMNEISINTEGSDSGAENVNPSAQDHPMEKVVGMIAVNHPSSECLNILTELKLQCKKLVVNIDNRNFKYIVGYKSARLFANFMTNQRKLTEFVIKTSTENRIVRILIEQLKQCKLEKLAIRLQSDPDESLTLAERQIAELIRSQPALKEIEICCESIGQNVIRAIYETKNLQKLQLAVDDVEDLLKPSELPIPNAPHANLKTFIMEESPSQRALDALMKMFANVETLAIFVDSSEGSSSDSADSAEILLIAQNRLRSLKYLKISSVTDDFPAVNIPSMRKLQVRSVESFERFRSVLAQNPLLQELEIEEICNVPESLDLPTELVNLQKLTIGQSDDDDEFEINEEVLRDLKTSCPKLTKVEVGANGVFVADDIVDFSAIRVAKFDLNSSTNVFEKLTLTAFNDKEDSDLQCIWLKNDSSEDESDCCDCFYDNLHEGESFSEDGEEEDETADDEENPDEDVEEEEEEENYDE